MLRRFAGAGIFLGLLLVAYRFAGSQTAPTPPDQPELQRYRSAPAVVRALLGDPDLAIGESDGTDLSGATQTLGVVSPLWDKSSAQDLDLLFTAKGLSSR